MEQQYVSRCIANFGAKICKESNTCRPTLCSPLSAETVMAMLALGCSDRSKAEVLRALGFPDQEALLSSFSFVTSTLKSIKGATLNVANKIYLKTNAELKPRVKKDVEEVFETNIEHIDFSRLAAAASTINDWVAQQTNNSSSLNTYLNESTRLLLLNVIYFQGVWEKPFDTRFNTSCFFHTPHNTTTEVTLMRNPRSWFNYGVSVPLRARLLELKFNGVEASMVIILPDQAYGLTEILRMLNAGHNIMADIESLKKTELDVMIPIFQAQMTSQLNLVTNLLKLGIRTIFDERRSEVDMLTTNELLLGSDSGQHTSIKVDGRRSTNPAECSKRAADDPSTSKGYFIKRFVANRPFLYMIVVRGLPIFMGTFKGRQDDVLDYSSHYLNHTFTLSACTYYSRYDNRIEQQHLARLLDHHTRDIILAATDENRRNRATEISQYYFRHAMDLIDSDEENMYQI